MSRYQPESKDPVMYSWVSVMASNDGEADSWAYHNKDKTLAVVWRINGMYRWRVEGTKIEGTEQTRTSAMMRARQEWEAKTFGR